MHQHISLREANQHLSQYIKAVERGEEIIITKRGKPIARLLPMPKKRELSVDQKKAYKSLMTKLRKGYSLGGKKFNRDATHSIRAPLSQ